MSVKGPNSEGGLPPARSSSEPEKPIATKVAAKALSNQQEATGLSKKPTAAGHHKNIDNVVSRTQRLGVPSNKVPGLLTRYENLTDSEKSSFLYKNLQDEATKKKRDVSFKANAIRNLPEEKCALILQEMHKLDKAQEMIQKGEEAKVTSPITTDEENSSLSPSESEYSLQSLSSDVTALQKEDDFTSEEEHLSSSTSTSSLQSLDSEETAVQEEELLSPSVRESVEKQEPVPSIKSPPKVDTQKIHSISKKEEDEFLSLQEKIIIGAAVLSILGVIVLRPKSN